MVFVERSGKVPMEDSFSFSNADQERLRTSLGDLAKKPKRAEPVAESKGQNPKALEMVAGPEQLDRGENPSLLFQKNESVFARTLRQLLGKDLSDKEIARAKASRNAAEMRAFPTMKNETDVVNHAIDVANRLGWSDPKGYRESSSQSPTL
ncbi:MAG: hypothetical protein AAB839_00400 [Patescibacteria group bacterium]